MLPIAWYIEHTCAKLDKPSINRNKRLLATEADGAGGDGGPEWQLLRPAHLWNVPAKFCHSPI